MEITKVIRARVVTMSQSGQSALLSVEEECGPVVRETVGWCRVTTVFNQGEMLEIPTTRVSAVRRVVRDEETGATREFDWLVFT